MKYDRSMDEDEPLDTCSFMDSLSQQSYAEEDEEDENETSWRAEAGFYGTTPDEDDYI